MSLLFASHFDLTSSYYIYFISAAALPGLSFLIIAASSFQFLRIYCTCRRSPLFQRPRSRCISCNSQPHRCLRPCLLFAPGHGR
ncbi:hypothetical protein FGO68_gene7472 [Halteria grandinella]|uniref:Uncharacterized protein n=1 Tax=Halteria grandinella TaxID=5974 RepID=A0A8J8T316_HALGN|nr:hypothetical protein FGO68_gene7472 [Halteria grandinella]